VDVCVDLSFSRFETDVHVVALSPDLAVLMVGVAAPLAQARLPRIHASDPFTPAHGAFNVAVWEMVEFCGDWRKA
jgi:hypothetical protein